MDITKLQGSLPDLIYNQLQQVSDTFQVDNEVRMACFLGQCDHESEEFTHLVENLNYSGAALWSLFSRHFASAEEANTYERQPERIANRIYANRMGNGDEASGDGWLNRGKGCIMITGASMTKAFFKSIGLDESSDPMLIATQYPLLSAAWFWNMQNLNKIADEGVNDATVTAITKVINGGEIGLPDRITKTNHYFGLLTA